ncbi:hypothetical protein C5167_019017 [Papaver somniferum]|uniref:Geranylgeranyl transferase type II subunit beta n=1 Tax=Papaver somniferum TaxID=3469 RepID=A0A4Y7IR24_PAPSO|nr:hypothetical protein C5167_019017 [Papaver somniferum]
MEHLRMSGAYWGLTTLDLVGKLGAVDRDEIVSWVMQCQHESARCSGHRQAIELFSYIAISCLSLLHRLDKINVEKAVEYIVSCKNL